jgi:hypothetical protein
MVQEFQRGVYGSNSIYKKKNIFPLSQIISHSKNLEDLKRIKFDQIYMIR